MFRNILEIKLRFITYCANATFLIIDFRDCELHYISINEINKIELVTLY